MTASLLIALDERGVARLTLNKPELHNAFDEVLIAQLRQALADLGADPRVRVLILTGAGKSFAAGADIQWMRRMALNARDENLRDAAELAALMHDLDRFPRPVIGLINGAAYGGGVGLAVCCDITIASERAAFCLSEVKLALIPAAISPYVVAAIGARQARRYFLTAEIITPQQALSIGLVHQVVAAENLEATGEAMAATLLQNAPQAMQEAKDLIFAVDRPLSDAVIADTSRRIAERRASEEGREGLSAYLEKRDPAWRATGRPA